MKKRRSCVIGMIVDIIIVRSVSVPTQSQRRMENGVARLF